MANIAIHTTVPHTTAITSTDWLEQTSATSIPPFLSSAPKKIRGGKFKRSCALELLPW